MTSKLLYHGRSMHPLMRDGDVVSVVPYQGEEIREGDVVAVPHPGKPGKVIHRVVAVKPWGIFTKGDNNSALDDWILKPGDILGQVVAIHRQGRTLPVPRQAPVPLYILKVRRWFDRKLSSLFSPLYHRVAQSGWLRGLLGAWISPRLIYISHTEGIEWQLWLGKLLIGRKQPQAPYWTIRRPFRLLVDEASLPHQAPDSPDLSR